MRGVVLLLAAVMVASAHMFFFSNPEATAPLVANQQAERDLLIACSPRMGMPNHGPMPYNLRTGWWYLTCNANAEGYTGDVGLEFVIFENWLNLVVLKADLLMLNAAVSLPSAPSGHRFHSYVQFKKVSTLPWYKTPINLGTENSTLAGDVNAWTASVHGKSQQTNETFAFEIAARWNKESVLLAHGNDTGCVTYDSTNPLWWDIFYHSVLSYTLAADDNGAKSRIRLPGETQWRTLNGTCHYDRQHAVIASSGQWQWGQATFQKELPAGYEKLEGAHIVWWALYSDALLTKLGNAHVAIKHRDRALEEYDGVNLTIVNRRLEPRYNTTFAYDVIINVPQLAITLRATATVPEAVVPVAAKTASGGLQADKTYMESPCEYRLGSSLAGTVIGTGYMEVTSGETPINVPTDGITNVLF